MAAEVILLGTGFLLSVILLLLLIIMAKSESPTPRKKVREDIKKIKEQINAKS